MNTVTLESFKDLKKWRPWTKQEDRRLRQLYQQNEPDKKIADLLGRTELSVGMRRSKIGVTKFRRKAKRKLGGGASILKTPKLPKDEFEALKQTQSILKALGYRLVIAKITE